MSDLGRYRKAYPRIWRHPGFRELSRDEQRLVLYLLTGPQTNRIGLFHFSAFTAADDLDTTPETLKKGLGNVTVTFGWMFDADAKVFYIPSWWKWNKPENANVIKGALKDLNEVPPCSLVDAFAENVGEIQDDLDKNGKSLRGTFLEGLLQRLPKRSGTQEQEHFSNRKQKQKQEQEHPENPEKASVRGISSVADTRVHRIACDVVRDYPGSDPNYQVDAVLDGARRQHHIDVDRNAALLALSQARRSA